MEDIMSIWNELGILDSIMKSKLMFIETPSVQETAIAMRNYRKACDSGRGAIFFSIARGKVAEGVDFDGHYGRVVVMFGVPFMNTESQILKERLIYLQNRYNIRDGDFLTFDALRHASQCIGRVIRHKNDYGIMVLADKRYNRADKRTKLPGWIQNYLTEDRLNLSTDTAVAICKKFLLEMAQPYKKENQLGISLFTAEQIEKRAIKMQKEAAKQQEQQQQQQHNGMKITISTSGAAAVDAAKPGSKRIFSQMNTQ